MLTSWRRGADVRIATPSVGSPLGAPSVLAYLRDTTSRALCYYAPCPHPSVVALCDFDDNQVATYCSGHARQALREYGRALEGRFAEASEVA